MTGLTLSCDPSELWEGQMTINAMTCPAVPGWRDGCRPGHAESVFRRCIAIAFLALGGFAAPAFAVPDLSVTKVVNNAAPCVAGASPWSCKTQNFH